MYKHINKTKKGVLILVAVMLLTIPNISVYSAVGSYSMNSPNLVANSNEQFTGIDTEKAACPIVIQIWNYNHFGSSFWDFVFTSIE